MSRSRFKEHRERRLSLALRFLDPFRASPRAALPYGPTWLRAYVPSCLCALLHPRRRRDSTPRITDMQSVQPNSQPPTAQELAPNDSLALTYNPDRWTGQLPTGDADLERVRAAWPELPEPIRRAILALVSVMTTDSKPATRSASAPAGRSCRWLAAADRPGPPRRARPRHILEVQPTRVASRAAALLTQYRAHVGAARGWELDRAARCGQTHPRARQAMVRAQSHRRRTRGRGAGCASGLGNAMRGASNWAARDATRVGRPESRARFAECANGPRVANRAAANRTGPLRRLDVRTRRPSRFCGSCAREPRRGSAKMGRVSEATARELD